MIEKGNSGEKRYFSRGDIVLPRRFFPEEGLFEEVEDAIKQEISLGARGIGLFSSRLAVFTPEESDVDLFVVNPLVDGENLTNNAYYGHVLTQGVHKGYPVVHISRTKDISPETLQNNNFVKRTLAAIQWVWFK